ncbi:hypothetical protein NON20_20620 [Synechocystis sp. B12]|nr:hypothetical protein NON20_20620 [Synechocystis sp. B12]
MAFLPPAKFSSVSQGSKKHRYHGQWKGDSLLISTGDRLATIARPEAKPMKYHYSPWKLVLLAGTAFVLGTPTTVTAQSYNPVEPFPEDLPATGNINDLDGLQERQVEDWFPQQNMGTNSQTLLEINTTNTPPLSINDRSSQIKEENDWQRSSSGNPNKQVPVFPWVLFS